MGVVVRDPGKEAVTAEMMSRYMGSCHCPVAASAWLAPALSQQG